MGLKVVKCSDEAYAEICRVASENKTYLADAVDLIVFKKVRDDTRKDTKAKARRPRSKRGKAGEGNPKPETVGGVVDQELDEVDKFFR